MINWEMIDTVLLDMDGTLLDLHFDSYFWQEHLPRRYAEKHGMALDHARNDLSPRFEAVRESLQWYCLDYWSRHLDMDIAKLKEEVAHLIRVHPHVLEFLNCMRDMAKQTVLVTNAHHKSLALKLQRTPIGAYLDLIVSTHDLGLAKENPPFWQRFRSRHPFDAERTLLVDDNLAVLRAARQFGITHLLAIRRPDTGKDPIDTQEFAAIDDFSELIPAGLLMP